MTLTSLTLVPPTQDQLGIAPLTLHSEKLPKLSLIQAEFQQRFFAQRRHTQTTCSAGIGYWSVFYLNEQPREWIELASEQFKVLLSITGNTQHTTQSQPWWQYHGESRLLAWIIEHDRLLSQIDVLLGGGWRAKALYHWHATTPERHHYLGWQLRLDKQIFSGALVLPVEQASAWLESVSWTPQPSALPDLPVHLQLSLPPFSMTTAELTTFITGDVLMVDSVNHCWSHLSLTCMSSQQHLQPHSKLLTWQCVLTAQQQLCIQRLLDTTSIEAAITMNSVHPHDAITLPSQDADQPAANLDAMPLSVTIELAQLQLPLASLATLQPGYVINLQQPVDQCRVAIKVQQQHYGTGELVIIGDSLGIRLLDWNSDGSEHA